MKYKRGADLRIKFKHLKDNFISDLSELESEIVQSYENAPKDDNLNINELYMCMCIICKVYVHLYTYFIFLQ